MVSPEELGQDASAKDPTRGDDIPGRAHQKICEVRPPRQAAYHAVGERGPADAHPDESLEQPLPGEFATARAHVGRQYRGGERAPALTPYPPLPPGEGELWTSPLSGTERGTGGEDGDQALGRELGAPQSSVDPLARKWIEEVGGVTHEHCAASRRDGRARPLRERTRGQHIANQTPGVEPPREPGKLLELGEEPCAEVPLAAAALPPYRGERQHQR